MACGFAYDLEKNDFLPSPLTSAQADQPSIWNALVDESFSQDDSAHCNAEKLLAEFEVFSAEVLAISAEGDAHQTHSVTSNFVEDVRNGLIRFEQCKRGTFDRVDVAPNALKVALGAAQDRCETINKEMLQVADVHDDLILAIQVEKASHRELLDQVRKRAENISSLTRKQLTAENRFEEKIIAQESAAEVQEQNFENRLNMAMRAEEVADGQARVRFSAEKARFREAMRPIVAKVADLRRSQGCFSNAIRVGLAESQTAVLDGLGQRLLRQVAAHCKHDQDYLVNIQEQLRTLSGRISSEKQSHGKEAQMREVKGAALLAESKDATAEKDVAWSHVRGDIEAIETERQVEAEALEKDLTSCSDRLVQVVSDISSLDVKLLGAQGLVEAMQTRHNAKEAELANVDRELNASRIQLIHSDESFERVAETCECLRQELDTERCMLQCDEIIRDGFAAGGAELETVLAEGRQDASRYIEKLTEMEQIAAGLSADIVSVELEADRCVFEETTLLRERSMWRAQAELASGVHRDVARDLSEVNAEWQHQLASLRAECDALETQKNITEEDLQELENQHDQLQDDARQRMSEVRERMLICDARLHKAEEERNLSKKAVRESGGDLTIAQQQKHAAQVDALEAKHAADRRVHEAVNELAKTRKLLLDQVMSEKMCVESVRAEQEKIKMESHEQLETIRQKPPDKIFKLESELRDFELNQNQLVRSMEHELDCSKARNASLEISAANTQNELQDVDAYLDENAVKLRASHAAGSAARARLVAAVARMSLKLNEAKEHQKRLHAEAAEHRCAESLEEDIRLKELAELTILQDKLTTEGDCRVEDARRRCAGEFEANEKALREDTQREEKEIMEAQARLSMSRRQLMRPITSSTSSPSLLTPPASSLFQTGSASTYAGSPGLGVAGIRSSSFTGISPMGSTSLFGSATRSGGAAKQDAIDDNISRMMFRTEQLRQQLRQRSASVTSRNVRN